MMLAAVTVILLKKYVKTIDVSGTSSVVVVIACYSLCSSSLLIIYKVHSGCLHI